MAGAFKPAAQMALIGEAQVGGDVGGCAASRKLATGLG